MARPPEAFVPRHQLGTLVGLLCQAAGARVGITTALRGDGGSGKTTLARQLCFEPEVQRAYPDGILWVTMGEHLSEAGRLDRVLDLIRWWSSAEPPAFTEVEAASAELRWRLAGKRVLVVVDDVWQSVSLEPFQGLQAGAAVLVTTRDRRTLPRGSQEIAVDAFRPTSERRGDLPSDDADAWHHLSHADQSDRPRSLLFDFAWLDAKLRATGVRALLADFEHVVPLLEQDIEARLVHDALRLSSHVLAEDADQLPSQLVGRLGDFEESHAGIRDLLAQARMQARTPWLCPIRPSLTAPGGSTRVGYEFWVTAVIVTPDGRHAVSTSESDYPLKVWDLHTGQLLHTQHGASDGALAVAVTPAGYSVIFTAGLNGSTLEVRDLHTGQLLRTLVGHGDTMWAVAVTPDGQHAVSAGVDSSEDPILNVWDLHTGQLLRTLDVQHGDLVGTVAIAPDGQHAVSVSFDLSTLNVWDLHTGQLLRTLDGHRTLGWGVHITPDGNVGICPSHNRSTRKVWDLRTRQLLHLLVRHVASFTDVAITPDGQRAVSASEDHILKVWDLHTGKLLHSLVGHTASLTDVAITPDGQRVVSASRDHTLKVWDIDSGRVIATFTGDDYMRCIAASDGDRIVAGDRMGRVHFLRLIRENT